MRREARNTKAGSSVLQVSYFCNRLGRSHLSQRGFTLLELLVTLGIVAIVAAIAAPSFDRMAKNSRLDSIQRSFANAVKYARAEAITRKEQISMCPSTDQVSCGGNWSDGWIVYVDDSGDEARDAGEEILETHYGDAHVNEDGATTTVATLSFLANGIKTVAGTSVIGFCDPSAGTTVNDRELRIQTTGSVSYQSATTTGC